MIEKLHNRPEKQFMRFERDVESFNEVAVAVMRDLHVAVIDVHTTVKCAMNDYLGTDGVHMTDSGYKRLGGVVADAIASLV